MALKVGLRKKTVHLKDAMLMEEGGQSPSFRCNCKNLGVRAGASQQRAPAVTTMGI